MRQMRLNGGRGHVFFFQAEDGIRDGRVTGVQTCALPIWLSGVPRRGKRASGTPLRASGGGRPRRGRRPPTGGGQIGRASCRERVEISGVAASLKKKGQTVRRQRSAG